MQGIAVSGSITSVNLATYSDRSPAICCLNGETYRAQIRATHTDNSNNGDWSAWVSFTFTGTSSVTATPTVTGTPPTATPTPIPSTATPTPIPPTGTPTPIPPTATPTPTATTAPPSPPSLSVAASTGIASWTAVTGATDYWLELEVINGTKTSLRPGSHNTSVNFTTAPNATNCCVNSEKYRTRIKVAVGSLESAWSSWVNFTYIGTSSIIATLVPPPTATNISVPPPLPDPDEEDDRDEPSDSGASIAVRPAATATPDRSRLPIPTLDDSRLPAGAEILHSGRPWTSFRAVSGAGIGSRSLLERGARQAIDVSGPLGVDAEVCFDGIGTLILLDAAYSPRRETPIESHRRGDKTCGYLDRPGTLVLMPGEPSQTIVRGLRPTATLPPGLSNPFLVPDDPSSAWSLADCRISSVQTLNVREQPGGQQSWAGIWAKSRRLSRARPHWFRVDFNGRAGWVSSHWVTTDGDCS